MYLVLIAQVVFLSERGPKVRDPHRKSQTPLPTYIGQYRWRGQQ